MTTGSNSGGTLTITSDESAVLSYLRGLPDDGGGYPWTRALDNADKSLATMFHCDGEANKKAFALSAAGAVNWEQGKEDATHWDRVGI